MHTDTIMLTVIELDCSIYSNRRPLTESIYLLKTNLVTEEKKNSKTGFEFLCHKILQIPNSQITSGSPKCHKGGSNLPRPHPVIFFIFIVCLESPENQVTQTPFRIKKKNLIYKI